MEGEGRVVIAIVVMDRVCVRQIVEGRRWVLRIAFAKKRTSCMEAFYFSVGTIVYDMDASSSSRIGTSAVVKRARQQRHGTGKQTAYCLLLCIVDFKTMRAHSHPTQNRHRKNSKTSPR